MALQIRPLKSQPHRAKKSESRASAPQRQPLDLSRSARRSDLEFDVRDLIAEIRSMTQEERERVIRSYA